MKKIFIILFLFVSVAGFSQILDFEYELEIGYMPLDVLKTTIFTDNNNSEYIKLSANILLLDLFFIGGSMQNNFYITADSWSGVPYFSNFMFTFGIKKDGFEIGFRHYCQHPIVSNGRIETTIQ